MKFTKTITALLLAACMLFAVACTGSNEESSGADSADSESSAVSPVSTEYTAKIDSLLSDSADRTVKSINLLKGLDYNVSRAAHEDYPDSKKLLTDGVKPATFGKDVWAGYYGRDALKIDFDLGEVKEGLLDFSVCALNYQSYAIGAPSSVKVYIAGDDEDYTLIGTAIRPTDISANEAWNYSVLLQGSVSARYIRFEVETGGSVWLFIGEASAIAYSEKYEGEESGAVSGDSYYGFNGVPEIDSPEYWSDSESDYNTTINLASGITPMMTAGSSISAELATSWYNSKTLGQLTDGKRAINATISDSAWVHTTRATDRTVIIDLGKTSAVSGFSAGFLRDTAAGVKLPAYLTVKVSENGKDWQTVYFEKAVTGSAASCIKRVEEDFDKEYKARFVQIYFMVNPHVYIDEIQVFGKKNADKAAEIVPDDPTVAGIAGGSYIMPDDFYGVNNMLLSYNCLIDGANNQIEDGLITVDEYLPYVAYLDEEGNIKDTFFDSFLYLPYTAFNYSDYGRSADGWRTYLDNIYYKDRNMDALDECVGMVYSELGETGKVPVFTSILYTFLTLKNGNVNNFGDIDGDGKDEDFTNIADRKKAIKWLMDEEINRFNKGGYENLEFCGYYWFEESIDRSDPHEEELIAFAVNYAHQLGVKVLWIPYQQASGYSDWQEFGFDLACMQPNYMFNATASSEVLYTTATQTQLLGMCVEMEINDPTSRNDASKYIEYMVAGAQTGYMNAVKIYYQNGVPGAYYTCCYSKDPAVRKLYDDTYLYAKCKYEVSDLSDAVVSPESLEFSGKSNKSIRGKIDISEVEKYGGKLSIAESPRYGALCLNNDGSFVYKPAADYVGTDTFSVCIDLGYVRSEPAVITIVIE